MASCSGYWYDLKSDSAVLILGLCCGPKQVQSKALRLAVLSSRFHLKAV